MSTLGDLPVAAPAMGLLRHVRETLTLGLPVMVARSGMLAMVTVDIIMTGRYDALELAYYSLAFAPSMNLFILGLGFMTGSMVLVAQAEGRGDSAQVGTIWKVALMHAALLGSLFALTSPLAGWFFAVTGQSEDMAREARSLYSIFAVGLPAMLFYQASVFLLEGIQRPRVNMVLMLAANALNAGLNWLLIYEHAWGGGMGAQGAALGITITRWCMALALGAFVLWMPGQARYGIRTALHDGMGIAHRLWRLGGPIGIAMALESMVFTTMVIMAGRLGALSLAAYQIAQSVFTVVFMVAIGLATATAVRVGNAVGRGNWTDVSRAGWTGIGAGTLVLCAGMALVFFTRFGMASIYTHDEVVARMGASALGVVAFFVLSDGGQGIMNGALRGAGDVWVPMVLMACGFWAVTIPLGWWLAFHTSAGVNGLIWALCCGAAVAMLLMMVRFRQITRRHIRNRPASA